MVFLKIMLDRVVNNMEKEPVDKIDFYAIRVKWQIIGWLGLISFYLIYKEFIVGIRFGRNIDFVIFVTYSIFLFYLNILWVLPKAFRNKKKAIYKVPLFLLLEVIVILIVLIGLSICLGGLELNFKGSFALVSIINFFPIFFLVFYGLILSLCYYGILWGLTQKKAKELKREQIAKLENEVRVSELEWLKAKLPTHFLNNTLPILRYALVHEPAIGAAGLNLFSEIVKYYTERTNKGLILLSSEIEQVKRYMAFRELAMEREFHLQIDCKGELLGVKTLPMIVLLLAENIYKYGVLADSENPARISVRVEAQQVFIFAHNSIGAQERGIPSTGIGLQNLRDRLAHFYPDRHSFSIENTGNYFSVDIRISL